MRRIGTGRCEGVGLRSPDLQVFEDSFDHIDIVDERDDAHVAAAVNTRKRIDLVYLLNQSYQAALRRVLTDGSSMWIDPPVDGRWEIPQATDNNDWH